MFKMRVYYFNTIHTKVYINQQKNNSPVSLSTESGLLLLTKSILKPENYKNTYYSLCCQTKPIQQ